MLHVYRKYSYFMYVQHGEYVCTVHTSRYLYDCIASVSAPASASAAEGRRKKEEGRRKKGGKKGMICPWYWKSGREVDCPMLVVSIYLQ